MHQTNTVPLMSGHTRNSVAMETPFPATAAESSRLMRTNTSISLSAQILFGAAPIADRQRPSTIPTSRNVMASNDHRTEDLVARLQDDSYCTSSDVWALRREAAEELARLTVIEALARELVTTGMSLRFTSGPALSVIEKYDKSDPHYQLCKALELTAPRART
jgi:hypothetical protein